MHSPLVVLESESKEIFQSFADLYHDVFLPRDQFESDLVDSLIHARWKIRRLETAHSAELNLAIVEHMPEYAEKFGPSINPNFLQALAYRSNGKYIEILDRHLDRQERLFTRTYRNLSKHRKGTPLPSIDELQDLEIEYPSNSGIENEAFEPEPPPESIPQPTPEIENERFEPELEPQPEPKPQPQPQSQPVQADYIVLTDPSDPFLGWPEQMRNIIQSYPPIREAILAALANEIKKTRA